VDCLLSEEWLGHADIASPVMICGDFNALPRSRVMRRLQARLHNVQESLDGHRPQATWPSRFPAARIDHILIDSSLTVEALHVPRSSLARIASDHLPLVADLRLKLLPGEFT
jgi:endonuclease/exonuclease/phosphatase family metal-dependent hydrolase